MLQDSPLEFLDFEMVTLFELQLLLWCPDHYWIATAANFVLFGNHVGLATLIWWRLWLGIGSTAFMFCDTPQGYSNLSLLGSWIWDACSKDFAWICISFGKDCHYLRWKLFWIPWGLKEAEGNLWTDSVVPQRINELCSTFLCGLQWQITNLKFPYHRWCINFLIFLLPLSSYQILWFSLLASFK